MPDQNQPKAPAFNPKLKDAIVALKAENNPKNLNAVLNELVRSPLLAPANFDLQGQSAPTPGPDGRRNQAAARQASKGGPMRLRKEGQKTKTTARYQAKQAHFDG